MVSVLDRLQEFVKQDALIWNNKSFSYEWLNQRVAFNETIIKENQIPKGAVVILEGDFSPGSIALFVTLLKNENIVVPLTDSVQQKKAEFIDIAQGEIRAVIDKNDNAAFAPLKQKAKYDYYKRLREAAHPGLVLFSSGSTGNSKAVVLNMALMLQKFQKPRKVFRTVSFLLYDHIGGINTMLHVLLNGGCLVTVSERSPDAVLSAIERYQVELLPTSPTFMNLILLSEAYKNYDLKTLKKVSYGTEPMPEATLHRFHELFPAIELIQTYGLSEVGILRTKSKDSDSLWVKMEGEDFKIRVVNGILQVKTSTAMLGYLNEKSPFTDDGWFITGDAVEVDGEFIKILGRKSEMINVGGQKVYPAEVEGVIHGMENVANVSVYSEKNPITGQIVCAKVSLKKPQERKVFVVELKNYCKKRLESFKVPVKVDIVDDMQYTQRFKKTRILT